MSIFKRLFSFNKASIDKNSNHNTIIQDSHIDKLLVANTGGDFISALGQMKLYDAVQQQTLSTIMSASRTHPLYPMFSAKPSGDFTKLVSTPETADAFTKYPKSIRGTFLVDYKKYPYMNKAETPWEYAYRTQTKVELKTTAYQEYLGDIEDPFPNARYSDGMITVIGYHEFPPAVSATISSGSVTIPIMLRRRPCMEYGKMVFSTTSSEQGFEFKLTTYNGLEKTDFNITKAPECDLQIQLQRERLLLEMSKTKHLVISIGESPLVDASFKEDELKADIFKAAPYMVTYLESLLTIEEHTGCKFDLTLGDVFKDDYRTALIMAASLENKWHMIKTDFDDDTRCDYSEIPEDFADIAMPDTYTSIEGKVLNISLQGQHFSSEKYTVVYKDARVNNADSVRRSIRKKKKNIMITFRPIQGKEYFCKYYHLEGIKVVSTKQ